MTTIRLDKEARLAVKRLQLRREENNAHVTFRELVLEGLALLLKEEGLQPMNCPESPIQRTVVEISRR